MPLLRTVAESLSNAELEAGIIETIYTQDDFFSVLDFMQVNNKYLAYERELALPSTAYVAPGDTIAESAGTVEDVVSYLRAIVGDVDVDNFLDETMGDTNNQEAVQIAMKVKATARKFQQSLITGKAYTATSTAGGTWITAYPEVSDNHGRTNSNGKLTLDHTAHTLSYQANGDTAAGTAVDVSADGTYTLASASPSKWIKVTITAANEPASGSFPVTVTETKEFTGLSKLCAPTQVISAGTNGAALSWSLLDQLKDAITIGQPDFFLFPKRTIRAYKALLRAAGGVDSAMLQLPNFGRPVLTFDGIPVLANDFIPVNLAQGSSGNVCTEIYAGKVGEDGLQGLYGGPNAGIRVSNVGEVQDKDATRTRVKWYCGLRLKSQLALAKVTGITN